jgi:hypothetical protein
VSTVHVVPVNDLVEHECEGTDCICGPDLEQVEGDDGDGWLVTHHSLDGRERFEAAS